MLPPMMFTLVVAGVIAVGPNSQTSEADGIQHTLFVACFPGTSVHNKGPKRDDLPSGRPRVRDVSEAKFRVPSFNFGSVIWNTVILTLCVSLVLLAGGSPICDLYEEYCQSYTQDRQSESFGEDEKR